ncbi:MAG TPA: glycosyltransferase family 9 protein [Methylomirabilota bacterium]|nr:glycosyltransferase family 9 protein [Methylomirabilota bacterium]
MLAAQPRLGALLAALGLVDAHMSVERLGLERLFVDDGEPPLEALRAASPVVCWFAARDPVFVRRLREAVPEAVVASPIGDGSRPVWEHLLATVGSARGPWRDPLAVPAPLAASGHAALRGAGWDGATPLVLVHAGAGGLGKRWPVDGFARALHAVSARRRLALALVQGPADADATAALAARLPDAAVLPEMSLGDLAGALGHAGAWLGNDSGIGHLAAAMGVPTLVLFKAANLAWRSWSASARTVTVDPGALKEEDVSAVVAGLEALLGGERGP